MLNKYRCWRLQSKIDSLRVVIAYWQARLTVAETAAAKLGSYTWYMSEITKAKTNTETKKVELATAERKLKELTTKTINIK